MFERDQLQYINTQFKNISSLVNEAVTSKTKVDALSNSAQPLRGEAEAMYFKAIRVFFENIVSRKIMNHNHDVYRGM